MKIFVRRSLAIALIAFAVFLADKSIDSFTSIAHASSRLYLECQQLDPIQSTFPGGKSVGAICQQTLKRADQIMMQTVDVSVWLLAASGLLLVVGIVIGVSRKNLGTAP